MADKVDAPGPYGEPIPEDLSTYHGASPAPEAPRYAEARIYRRSASPVQNGPAHIGEWILEFEPAAAPGIEPLMGWISSQDVLQQVRLTFDSREAAETYCRNAGLACTIPTPAPRKRRPRSYSDNFVPFEDGTPRPIYPH